MNDRLTSFLQSRKNRIFSIILVVVMHGGALWFLLGALGTKHVEKHAEPMPITVEVPSASSAAAAAPPPPPEMITPPPPTLPPPRLNINIPPPPKVAKPQPKPKHMSKPVPTPTHAAEPGPVNPNPSTQGSSTGKASAPSHNTGGDHSASAQPIAGGQPEYPPEMEEQNRQGSVRISCDIDPTGHPKNCNVVSSSGGQAFVESTLRFLRERARYRPAVKNGVPTVEHNHIYNFRFQL